MDGNSSTAIDICGHISRYYFNNTREIFSVIIAGQKMYIVTSPKDISTVYKNPQNLAFDGFVKDMYARFGMSPMGVEKMFAPILLKHDTALDAGGQQRAHLGTGVQKEQLHPGPNLDDLIKVYLGYIEPQMDMGRIPESCIVRSSGDSKVVSLRNWCSAVLGAATIEAFFGTTLLELNPQLPEDFHIFDVNSWMFLYQYPRGAAKAMFNSLERTTRAFTRYFDLPIKERSQACHYIRTLEAKQRDAGISSRVIAISTQGMF
ncbi:hypothetical protein MMC30_003629 [Trapelia coarctata]|nr:hypothetical protein [Trapelia coarctata]